MAISYLIGKLISWAGFFAALATLIKEESI